MIYEEALITAKSTYDQAAVNSNYAENDYQKEIQDKAEKVNEVKAEAGQDVLKLFKDLNEMGHTIVMITHDCL